MKKPTNNLTTAIVITVAILLIYVTGSFLFNHFAREWIKKISQTQSSLSFDEINTRLLKRQVTANNTEYKSYASGSDIQILKIKLRGIHLFQVLFSGELVINQLTINEPVINYPIQLKINHQETIIRGMM